MTPSKDTLLVSVHLAASSDLAAVNSAVALYESILGPLVKMDIQNDTTLLTFAATEPSPATPAMIAAQAGGTPTIPPGAKLVAAGRIYLVGITTLCAATRG